MGQTYSELYETFAWHVPKGFNLADACCLQWSGLPGHERRAALIHQDLSGSARMTSFAELGEMTSQLANGLTRLGVIPGDRVVILLSQTDDVMVALLACWAIRAVAVPLAPDLSADALLPKLKHARTQVALIDAQTQTQGLAAIARCPRVKHVVGIDVYDGRVMNWRGLLARQPNVYVPNDTLPSDPALLLWPQTTLPDLSNGSALVMAHQSLIGQLPGFVMAANWFPDGANQLLTTFKPWEDIGLLAAILPALYFGNTVVLADKLPTPSNLTRAVTHVVTRGDRLIDALRHEAANHHEPTTPRALKAISVLDPVLTSSWRARATNAFGVEPNVATFVGGCGLVLAQCQDKWSEPASSSGRLVPGHQVRLVNHDGEVIESGNEVGKLQVARTDATGHTDPAQYIQAWPVKETECNESNEDNEGHDLWRVFGDAASWQTIGSCTFSFWELEQVLLAAADIGWAQIAVIPTRKTAAADWEIWALVDAGSIVERQLKPWREAFRDTITQAVASLVPSAADNVRVRVGLVDHLALSETDRQSRLPWQTRAYSALVDFL